MLFAGRSPGTAETSVAAKTSPTQSPGRSCSKLPGSPNVDRCFSAPDRSHPCRQVVFAQELGRADFHLPEPWSGRIESAPNLFVSSNPSFNPREDFPTVSWDDDRIEAFFTTRFEAERR